MAIGMVELHGTITRQQDFQTMQHNEDQKGIIDHYNQQVQVERNVSDQVNQVHKKENASQNSDANGEHKNSYQGDGGSKRKKEEQTNGKIVKKNTSSFDIRI